jgi:hypothetical protein
VKNVRFSKVVERCGRPETHLVLTDPAKDRTLQAAVKAQRVMTVRQETVGTKTDRGEVGFHPGQTRQFFVFPKSLRAFADRSVVGIKYDLLSPPEGVKNERAAAARPPKNPKRKSVPKARAEQPTKQACAGKRSPLSFGAKRKSGGRPAKPN